MLQVQIQLVGSTSARCMVFILCTESRYKVRGGFADATILSEQKLYTVQYVQYSTTGSSIGAYIHNYLWLVPGKTNICSRSRYVSIYLQIRRFLGIDKTVFWKGPRRLAVCK